MATWASGLVGDGAVGDGAVGDGAIGEGALRDGAVHVVPSWQPASAKTRLTAIQANAERLRDTFLLPRHFENRLVQFGCHCRVRSTSVLLLSCSPGTPAAAHYSLSRFDDCHTNVEPVAVVVSEADLEIHMNTGFPRSPLPGQPSGPTRASHLPAGHLKITGPPASLSRGRRKSSLSARATVRSARYRETREVGRNLLTSRSRRDSS